jgi:hypothetical protein
MAISKSRLIQKVRNRLGEPMVKVELCDEQICDHIDYARQKYIKWAIGSATQETYFTIMLQAGKRFYDLPAGVVEVVEYDDNPISMGGINTLFTMDNWMFQNGFYGNMFTGGYDLISYHLVLDFMQTLDRYSTTQYNWKYHKSTNQLEINPAPPMNSGNIYRQGTDMETGHPKEYLFDSPGFVMLRTYMVEGSSLPDYIPDWTDTLREIKTVIETHKIGQTELANKSFLLDHSPCIDYNDKFDYNVPEDMKMTVNGRVVEKYVDWDQLSTNRRVVTWNELGLDGVLNEDDEIVISYPVVYLSEYYPDEWNTVTVTSSEIEQITINQSHIDNQSFTLSWKVWDDNIKISKKNGNQFDIQPFDSYIVDPLDRKKIKWDGLSFGNNLSIGDVVNISYVTARSKRPDSKKAKGSKIRHYQTKIENRVLTQEEIDNNSLTTEHPISVSDGVRFSVGAFNRILGLDYRVEGDDLIAWDGMGLDGTLSVGDEVIITYTSATYIEMEVEEQIYDEDWVFDYVTALSKISLGLIRRKFDSFSSMGNQGISLDGSDLISEGNTEKEYLETTLRDEEALEGYGIIIGMM